MGNCHETYFWPSASLLDHAIRLVLRVSSPEVICKIEMLIQPRSIVGAAIGGTLADPVKNYPSVFGESVFFKEYPYLLPNIVCTAVVVLGLIVGFLFLEETHQDKRNRNDIGLVLGRQILRAVPCLGTASAEDAESDEARRCADDEKGDYQPIPTSPQMLATTRLNDEPTTSISEKTLEGETQEPKPEPKVSFYKSLTKQIKLIIVSYGLLAL